MSDTSDILTDRYGARVQVGNYRFSSVGRRFTDISYGSYLTQEFTTINSVQVDFHPADYNRLVDTLGYIHGTFEADRSYNNSTVHDKFVQHVYQKEFKEQELREKHPLLQDLWNQYKTTLNLLASGNNIESNE